MNLFSVIDERCYLSQVSNLRTTRLSRHAQLCCTSLQKHSESMSHGCVDTRPKENKALPHTPVKGKSVFILALRLLHSDCVVPSDTNTNVRNRAELR